ncbi:rho GTPase-activating protein 20 [Rhinatrema bivittatum]|uniref:rho GTPase-activating protein 20 n=1 Tax=Rhinatrema bivittatum TaxID=194408 RepID=UPI001126F8AF|nr:rho GTPase-activating protein 20 [Rhinatrema bivittatum]
MEAMSPQQDHVGQARSSSLTGESNVPGLAEGKKKMKSLAQRRQSAPSLVLSKALNKSKILTRESCSSPISPEACPLVQTFIGGNRSFLMDGHVQLKTGLQTQERHLFLFTDILVIAKSKSPSHFKLKHRVRICEMWLAFCMEEVCEGSTNPERSFVVGWPTTNCVATFSSSEQKEKWLYFLQSRINEEKENDYPKSIPLKIFAKDIGSCAYSKTLTITNAETTYDVIKMALQQFGINGSERDYQLWVTSGKDDSPYPLIGHEHPFGIKMSQVRDAVPQIQASKDSLCPPDLQAPLLMEQLPQEKQCQFILKLSRLAVDQQLTELSQKPFKRKRSIINWAFWRGSGTHLDNVPLSPTSSAPRKLFGLSLAAICEEENFPKPILDMLSFLYREGPFTKGIFRRSANAKSCRELKERLNSGMEVHLACESIYVTASVFKDFLRNIPGSIFSWDLFDKWLSVMDHENLEEKIKGTQRLLDLLPRANVTLLRYLFGVLHSIDRQSDTNQMTALNLAVCIAPSLLWPPTPSSAEVEGELAKKVSFFVQFLIENCCKIFGEEVTSLNSDLSLRSDNREDGSDICSFQLIDSSYDSLENELNDDTDSMFSDLNKKRGQDNRSRDSVLTLSDCDLDSNEVEEIPIKLPPRSKPVEISSRLHHKSLSQEHSENESLCSSTSGYSSTTVSDAFRGSRRHRRCSEPTIALLASKLSQLNGPHENAARKTSCDAVMSRTEENYLKQLRSLQVEGQKLIDRSVTLGIDVSKSTVTNQNGVKKDTNNRLLPSSPLRLNICTRNSCSSLSSPGTSPSGSSMSSLDSAFSQFSDYSLFTPNETASPLDCIFHSQRKKGELSPDFMSSSPLSGVHLGSEVSSSPNQASSNNTVCMGKNSLEGMAQKNLITLHPSTWLKNGACTMKNWSLRKKEKASKQEEKYSNSVKITVCKAQTEYFNALEDHLYQQQGDAPKGLVATEVPNVAVKGGTCNFSPCQEEMQLNSSLFCQVEGKDKRLNTSQPLTNQNIVDKSGEEEERNSISVQSTVSKSNKLSLVEKEHSHIPQTVFYGQNISLVVQTNKRPSFNSFCLDAPQLLNSRPQSSHGQTVVSSDGHEHLIKDNISKTALCKGTSIQATVFKKNKVLPSDMNPEGNRASHETENRICVSPKLSSAGEDYFFQPNIHKCLKKSTEVTSTKECHTECCCNPKFEEIEQSLFAEESYV